MSTTVFNIAKKKYSPDDLAAATVKVLLIETACTINADHDDVAEILATGAEFSGTNYTSGVASTDRKTVVVTAAVDNGNDRATATTATTSWTAINGGNITQFLVYVHVSGVNDNLNIPVMIVDDASGLPLTTNGSDVNLAAQVIRYA